MFPLVVIPSHSCQGTFAGTSKPHLIVTLCSQSIFILVPRLLSPLPRGHVKPAVHPAWLPDSQAISNMQNIFKTVSDNVWTRRCGGSSKWQKNMSTLKRFHVCCEFCDEVMWTPSSVAGQQFRYTRYVCMKKMVNDLLLLFRRTI